VFDEEYDSLYKCNALERCVSKSWKNRRWTTFNNVVQNYMIVEHVVNNVNIVFVVQIQFLVVGLEVF